MGAMEEGSKAVGAVVTGLSGQPLALALVVVNVLFLAMSGWAFHVLSERAAAAAVQSHQLLVDLIKTCAGPDSKVHQ